MNHFLDIKLLSTQQIQQLVERALHFKQATVYPNYNAHTVATLFYEPSTRTRISFQLAAYKLGMQTINIEQQYSSETKGERIADTIKTLSAMGVDLLVIRHRQEGLAHELALQDDCAAHIINAGAGIDSHPSQAMLDLMTILERKPDLSQLKIAIVGNIRHSRVANSLQSLFAKLKVAQLTLVAPPIWQPDTVAYGKVTASLVDGLADADIVVCLRVQQERLACDEQFDLQRFRADYAITTARLQHAKTDVLLMYPGPVNRGVEIDSELVDGPHSLIWQQVENGVFMRMAILEAMVGGK